MGYLFFVNDEADVRVGILCNDELVVTWLLNWLLRSKSEEMTVVSLFNAEVDGLDKPQRQRYGLSVVQSELVDREAVWVPEKEREVGLVLDCVHGLDVDLIDAFSVLYVYE